MNVLNVKCYECEGNCENVPNERMEELGWYEFECLKCGEAFLMPNVDKSGA